MAKQVIQSVTPEAVKFVNDVEAPLTNLWGRWQDEKEYEDIKDYALPLKSVADAAGVEVIKMTKSPFGCHFRVKAGANAGRTFKVYFKGRYYGWQRIS